MRRIRQFFGLILILSLVGCATITQSVHTQDTVIIGGIKPVLQDDMGCGPAVLQMVVQYYGIDLNKRQIAKETSMTMGGTKVSEMVLFLNRHGLRVEILSSPDSVKSYIGREIPVIAEGKRFGMGQTTHVVLVVGYNAKAIYIIDPQRGGMTFMVNSEFNNWNKEYRRWAVAKK